jgi:hypothetical protein
MQILTTALIALNASTTALFPKNLNPVKLGHNNCFSDLEADDIVAKWLNIWSTGGIPEESHIYSTFSPNIRSYDAAFGGPTSGIDAIWEAITAAGRRTNESVTRFPLFTIHSCESDYDKAGIG